MQECFLRAILSLNDDHGNMRAWLYRVARNLLTDQLRSRRNGVSLDDLAETPSDAPGPLAAGAEPSGAEGAEAKAGGGWI